MRSIRQFASAGTVVLFLSILLGCGGGGNPNSPGIGPVLFSGRIAGNVTWSGRYRLTGDVTIPEGATLTIQPGTVVESMQDQDDQFGGMDTSRVEIIVDYYGTLIAEGTEASPIIFTSAATSPRADWYGLRLNGPTSRVRYCTVEYGWEGVPIEGGTPTVEYCTIQYTDGGVCLGVSVSLNALTVTNCSYGIYTYPAASEVALTLSNSTILNNGGNGVTAGDVIVSNSTISNNGDGVFAFGEATVSSNSTLSNNGRNGVEAYESTVSVSNSTISNNGEGGVYSYSFGTVNVSNSTISSNGGNGVSAPDFGSVSVTGSTISSNGGGGVYAYYGSTVSVTNSTISNNRYDGVDGGTASVTNSILSGNSGSGLAFATVGAQGISGNLIYRNSVGVSCSTGSVPGGNDIFGNTEYELRNTGSPAMSANGNYWGEPTTTELTNGQVNLTKIYDSRDDPNVGQVAITQWSPSRLTTFPLP